MNPKLPLYEDWRLNACVGTQYTDMHGCLLDAICDGYRKAASCIFAEVSSTRMHQDTLIYPYLQCVRHSVEIDLKRLIFDASTKQGKDASVEKTHDLLKLWKSARHELIQLPAVAGRCLELSETISVCISELADLMPTGQEVRYAAFASTPPESLDCKSLVNFRAIHETYVKASDSLFLLHSLLV